MTSHTATLSYCAGVPELYGRIRSVADDFVVREALNFTPDGVGEHLLLKVRKRGVNTMWVARQLARSVGVASGAVSFAGLKDRNAVAEQWFSIHLPGRAVIAQTAFNNFDEFSVLEQIRHRRKLKRGALESNEFSIIIRDLVGDVKKLERRWQRILTDGVPNYFGDQRFGNDADNLRHAEAMFLGRERVRDRHKRGLYLSAARAEVFNQILSRRVSEGSWNRALTGDVMMLAGSQSVFPIAHPDDTIQMRVLAQDIHPTGPLWGQGELLSQSTVLALESAVANHLAVLCEGLCQAGLRQERRALRVCLRDAELEQLPNEAVRIGFRLPKGTYATAVLRELVCFTV